MDAVGSRRGRATNNSPPAARCLRAPSDVEAHDACKPTTQWVGYTGHLPETCDDALPPLIVSASLQVSGAILLEAGLSFLGLGDPNFVSWGFMLHQSQEFFHQAWWMAAFPGGALFATALGLNLVGKGLNDALNPRLRMR